MDVDRIAAMGGVGQEQNPSWTREKIRRRKFAEQVPPEEADEAVEAAPEDEEHDGLLDVTA